MAEWFTSGRLVDLILALVALEIVALALLWRMKRRGLPLADLFPNILAGAFLLLTLRLSIGGFGWIPCCACLAAAGIAHVLDIKRRWM